MKTGAEIEEEDVLVTDQVDPSTEAPGRCIRRFAPTAVRNVKFRSSRQKEGPSIAGIVFQNTEHLGLRDSETEVFF